MVSSKQHQTFANAGVCNIFYWRRYRPDVWLDDISGSILPQSGKRQEVPPLPLCGGIHYCAPPGICRWSISAAVPRPKEDVGGCDDTTCRPPERTGCQATVVYVRRDPPLHCRSLPGHLHTSPCCCQAEAEAAWSRDVGQRWWRSTTTPEVSPGTWSWSRTSRQRRVNKRLSSEPDATVLFRTNHIFVEEFATSCVLIINVHFY